MTREELQEIKDRWDKCVERGYEADWTWFGDVAIGPLINAVERLMGDRDALLKACQGLLESYNMRPEHKWQAIDQARAAIAQALSKSE